MRIPTFLFCILTACSVLANTAEPIIGPARVLDGDTIAIGDRKIRLAHIDAAELKQLCTKKTTHVVYECGLEARDALWFLLEDHTVTCYVDKLDLYSRILAECFVNGININQYMVRTGNAVLYKSDKAYKSDQEAAKSEQLGVWATEFELPWEWRKNKKLYARSKLSAKGKKGSARTTSPTINKQN